MEGAAGAGAGGSTATKAQLRSLEAAPAGQAKDGAAQVRFGDRAVAVTRETPTTRYASSVTPGSARLPAGRLQVVVDLRALRGQDVCTASRRRRRPARAGSGAGCRTAACPQRSPPSLLAAPRCAVVFYRRWK